MVDDSELSDNFTSEIEDKEGSSCLAIENDDLVPMSCQKKAPYICQKAAGAVKDPRCPLGWFAYDGSCYKNFADEELTWFEAISFCFEYDAYPAIVDDGQELAILYNFASPNLWIGTNDLANEGVFVNIDETRLSRLDIRLNILFQIADEFLFLVRSILRLPKTSWQIA